MNYTPNLNSVLIHFVHDLFNFIAMLFCKFYCEQVERVRKFVLQHPSHKLVEIMVGDPNVGDYLAELFDVDQSCWGAHNVNPRSETHKELLAANGTVALAKSVPIAKRVRKKPKNETSVQLWKAQKAAKQRQRKQKRANDSRGELLHSSTHRIEMA